MKRERRYLLRLWREEIALDARPSAWRASLKSLPDRRVWVFANMASLQRFLDELGAESTRDID